MANIKRKVYKPSDYEDTFDPCVFKERLEQLLDQSGMTQTTLANNLDVKPLTVTRWKNGSCKNAVAYKYILQMAKIFGVEPAYLYDKEHHSPHLIQQAVDQNVVEGFERYRSFILFMDTLGFTIEPVPMNKFIIFKDSDSEKTYHELTCDELEKLIRKIALFTEMQLL